MQRDHPACLMNCITNIHYSMLTKSYLLSFVLTRKIYRCGNFYMQGTEADDVCGLCEDKEKLFKVWKGIVDFASKHGVSMSNEVQGIIVSTLAHM